MHRRQHESVVRYSPRWHLDHRERLRRLTSFGMIAAGTPLSFLGPLFLTVIVWFICRRWYPIEGSDFQISFKLFFLGISLIVLPLLYHLEWRTNGTFRADLSNAVDVPAGTATSLYVAGGGVMAAGVMAANSRSIASALVEVFLGGPRLVLGGLCKQRFAKRLASARTVRTERVIEELLRRDKGIESTNLLQGDEKMEDLMPSLAYLSYFDWIGVGKGWAKVWLFSESRRVLGKSK